MLLSEDIKNIDIYANQIRRYSLLTREQEIESFRDMDSKENEFLTALSEDSDIIRAALMEIRSTSKKDKHRDKAIQEYLDSTDGSQFLEACRKHAPLRSIQANVHQLVVKHGSKPKNAEWMARIAKAKRELDSMRSEFAKRNLRLVISISKKYGYLCRGIKILDLIQEGNIGLMRSIEKFDTRIDVRFATYASWWIRQSIVRALIDKNKSVRMPVHIYDKVIKVRKFETRFLSQFGRIPTNEEIAEEMDASLDIVKRWRESDLDGPDYSLDSPMEEGGDKFFIDYMQGEDGSRPEEELAHSHLKDVLDKAMECLTPRERLVIQERFGVEDRTLAEVGLLLQVSRERIRQIQTEALRKVRLKLNREELLAP